MIVPAPLSTAACRCSSPEMLTTSRNSRSGRHNQVRPISKIFSDNSRRLAHANCSRPAVGMSGKLISRLRSVMRRVLLLVRHNIQAAQIANLLAAICGNTASKCSITQADDFTRIFNELWPWKTTSLRILTAPFNRYFYWPMGRPFRAEQSPKR